MADQRVPCDRGRLRAADAHPQKILGKFPGKVDRITAEANRQPDTHCVSEPWPVRDSPLRRVATRAWTLEALFRWLPST
jgi:hypothetical protein